MPETRRVSILFLSRELRPYEKAMVYRKYALPGVRKVINAEHGPGRYSHHIECVSGQQQEPRAGSKPAGERGECCLRVAAQMQRHRQSYGKACSRHCFSRSIQAFAIVSDMIANRNRSWAVYGRSWSLVFVAAWKLACDVTNPFKSPLRDRVIAAKLIAQANCPTLSKTMSRKDR